MERTRLLDGIVIALIVLGLLAIAGGFVYERAAARHIGFALWWGAFTAVVIENYRSGRPVQTRGGVVRREDGAFRYALPYLGFLFMILISGVALLVAWIVP